MHSRLSGSAVVLIFLFLAAPRPAAAQTMAAAATTVAVQTAAGAAPFTPTVKVGGYVQAELDAGQQGDSRFPDTDRIFLRRARITLSGKVLPTLQYKLQGDFAGGLGAATSIKPSMTDGYIEWTKYAAAHIRVGQFKAGFGEEWLTPSTQLITAERTLTTDRLTLNRQIGAQIGGSLAHGRLDYSAGLFNGNGRNTTVNDNGKFMYTARGSAVLWQAPHGGSLRVGAAGYWSTARGLAEPADFGLDSTPDTPAADHLLTGTTRGVELNAQWLSSTWRVDGEFLRDRFAQDNGLVQPDVVGRGWYLMPAAFVYERTIQAVGRYEQFVPNTSLDGETTHEWLGGVNYYLRGLNKIMVDYLWIDGRVHPEAHNKVLAQLQVVF